MVMYQPRIPVKFTNSTGSAEFVFPLGDYSFDRDQGMRVPDAKAAGAHGSYDLLGVGAAPLDPAMISISYTIFDEDPEVVEETAEEQLQKIWSYGKGRLYTSGLVGGVDTLRWTRARAMAMPQPKWSAGDVVNKAFTVQFRCDPFWYGVDTFEDASVAATGTLTLAVQPTVGDTMTIGTKVFTFVAEVDANANGEIGIGANLAGAKTNVVAAINGTDGFNTAHTQVTAAAFVSNSCTITASGVGAYGNAIATTETYTSGSNVFAAATLTGGTGSPYAAGSFTINNPGNAPIYDAVITIEGTYSDPVTVTNTTNGYRLRNTGTGTNIRWDAGRPAVERWNGSSWVNDYSHFSRLTGQVHLMVLDPGDNAFTVSGATGTIAIDAYPAWLF